MFSAYHCASVTMVTRKLSFIYIYIYIYIYIVYEAWKLSLYPALCDNNFLYSKCSSWCLCHTKMQKWKRHVEEHPHFKQSTDLVNHAIHLVKLVYLCQIFQSEVSSTLCPLHSVFWTSCLVCNLFYWFSVLQHVALKCIPCKKFTKIVYVFSYIFKIIVFITSCKMPTGWLLFRKMQWLPALNYIKPLSKLISSLVSKIQFSQIQISLKKIWVHFVELNLQWEYKTTLPLETLTWLSEPVSKFAVPLGFELTIAPIKQNP